MHVSGVAGDVYRYLATFHGWLLMGLYTLIAGLVLVPATRLVALVWPAARMRFTDAVHRGLALYLRSVLYMRVEVEGAERRFDGTRVLVANHQSWLDPLVLMGLEARLQGPVRRYMIELPVFGWIVRQCGFFPGEAGDLPSWQVMSDSVAAARSAGGSLLFFPEGTRGRDGRVGSFHRGADWSPSSKPCAARHRRGRRRAASGPNAVRGAPPRGRRPRSAPRRSGCRSGSSRRAPSRR